MNLARWIIVFAVLSALGFGYKGWGAHKKRVELEVALEGEVEDLSARLLELSMEHTRLASQYSREGFKGQADLEVYIRDHASDNNVRLGNVDVDPKQETVSTGLIDNNWLIEPADKGRGANRANLANFMYLLESKSSRVKVTKVDLTQNERNLKEHEISNDEWDWKIQITSRQSVE